MLAQVARTGSRRNQHAPLHALFCLVTEQKYVLNLKPLNVSNLSNLNFSILKGQSTAR